MADDPKDNLEKDTEINQTQKELLADIKDQLIQQSDTLGGSLGRDTINVRRHLLEMKKMTADQLDNQKALNQTFGAQLENEEAKLEGESASKLNAQESSDDMRTIFEDIRDSLKDQPAALSKAGTKDSKNMAAGIMGGMGKMLGGLGIGIGAAGLGAGAVIGAGAYLLSVLDDIDAEKIKSNVANLLSISDLVEADGDSFLGEGGKFFLAMTGIGIGLAAFSAGAGAAAAVDYFTKDSDWSENVKENVISLLSISDSFEGGSGEMLKEGGTFFLTMAGLGLGLAAFGIGSAASGVGGAINKFAAGDNWAQNIKNEVETLLSIGDSGGGNLEVLGKSGTLALAMTGLAFGLAAFAIGKTVSGGAEAISKFSSGDNFAKDIKREVETLLSISQIEGIGWDTAQFAGVMGGLALGLVAFSAGKGAAGVADAITQFSAGDNFAEDIKKEVATLLTIGDLPGATLGQTTKSMAVLAALGTGLTAFGAGTFIAGLGQAGAAVLNFFTGTKSPIEQAKDLGENSDLIDKGVDSLNKFKSILDDFSEMGNIKFDMNTEEMADELMKATKVFELALEGGSDDGGFFGRTVEFKGLLNIEGIKEQAEEISLLMNSLFTIPSAGVALNAAGNPALAGPGITTTSIANAIDNRVASSTAVANYTQIQTSPQRETLDSITIG